MSNLKVGADPVNIAITPNGATAYVANAGSSSVSVINTATNTVVTNDRSRSDSVGYCYHPGPGSY